jgi:hypothetical protein
MDKHKRTPLFEYTVYVSKEKSIRAEQWCRETFGPRWSISQNHTGRWQCLWNGLHTNGDLNKYYRFHFTHKEDAVFFTLKWS